MPDPLDLERCGQCGGPLDELNDCPECDLTTEAKQEPDLPAAIAELDSLRVQLEQARTKANQTQQRLTEKEIALVDMCKALDTARQEIERVKGGRLFPIAAAMGAEPHPLNIPWSIAEKAYSAYAAKHGRAQSLERMAERGGFYPAEMDVLYPQWRDETNEVIQLRSDRDKALRVAEGAREELDAEQGRWQKAIYELCCRETKEFPEVNIDGAGCDSGDPLDLTLSEIRQAIVAWQDARNDLRGLVDEMAGEIKDVADTAEGQIQVEKLGGNIVKEEFWKGELSVARQVIAILARHDALKAGRGEAL